MFVAKHCIAYPVLCTHTHYNLLYTHVYPMMRGRIKGTTGRIYSISTRIQVWIYIRVLLNINNVRTCIQYQNTHAQIQYTWVIHTTIQSLCICMYIAVYTSFWSWSTMGTPLISSISSPGLRGLPTRLRGSLHTHTHTHTHTRYNIHVHVYMYTLLYHITVGLLSYTCTCS